MARLAIGAAFGVLVGLVAGAALGIHAEDEDPPIPADVLVSGIRLGLDPRALMGALNTLGVPLEEYLMAEGHIPRPAPPPPPARTATDRLVDCIIWGESRGVPSARNPRTGAAGLGQFLSGTWAGTPQGRAGLSVLDPVANRAAIYWMIAQGRRREFVAAAAC